jgi:hypothetical protein
LKRTKEEVLLQSVMMNKNILEFIDTHKVKDKRVKQVIEEMIKGRALSHIVNVLKDEDVAWFTELVLEEFDNCLKGGDRT